jgi:hypothetical protein
MTALNKKAFGGLLGLSVVMSALLFIPQWTLDFWQAWVFLGICRVGTGDHPLPYEKRFEAFGATGEFGTNGREGVEPKDHTTHHFDGIYRHACRPRA